MFSCRIKSYWFFPGNAATSHQQLNEFSCLCLCFQAPRQTLVCDLGCLLRWKLSRSFSVLFVLHHHHHKKQMKDHSFLSNSLKVLFSFLLLRLLITALSSLKVQTRRVPDQSTVAPPPRAPPPSHPARPLATPAARLARAPRAATRPSPSASSRRRRWR